MFDGEGSSEVLGWLNLTQTLDGSKTKYDNKLFKPKSKSKSSFQFVRIVGELSGLSPGLHGFHIHETGDLSDECRGAGGHYNPGGTNHGAPDVEVSDE